MSDLHCMSDEYLAEELRDEYLEKENQRQMDSQGIRLLT